MSSMKIFTGNANSEFALKISNHLQLPIGQATVGTFSDGETMVEILENVRGKDIFVIQSTCAPANDHLMELVIMADALRRASAGRITAVIPYFGYARQDRRVRSARVPITAKVVADMLASVGICRVLTVDLHADQIQGFFYMPVDNVYSTPVSTMSSIMIQFLSLGSPMMCITSDLLGPLRRLSIIESSASFKRFAIALARTTPPTSGDITIKLLRCCCLMSFSRYRWNHVFRSHRIEKKWRY